MSMVEGSPGVTRGDRESWRDPSVALVALGAVLFAAAAVWHGMEVAEVGSPVGPAAALVVDGVPALALVYVGRRLSRSDLSAVGRRTVAVWATAGVLVGTGVIGLTFLVRGLEGRTIAEPLFPLLTAGNLGGVAGAVAGYRDARARVDADRAETANEALMFLNGLIRHDLRNDLVAIQSAAELMGEAGDGDHAETIRTKADESLARIETTRAVAETLVGDPDTDRTDLAAVVEDVVETTDESVGASVTAETPEAAHVLANAGVRSVVDNLVENAVEHNDGPMADRRVEVTVERTDDTVRLSVADDGPGLSAERAAWVNGERVAPPDGTEGGLAIVRRLVTEYGGEIRVEDREPRGTVFTVELDRADAA